MDTRSTAECSRTIEEPDTARRDGGAPASRQIVLPGVECMVSGRIRSGAPVADAQLAPEDSCLCQKTETGVHPSALAADREPACDFAAHGAAAAARLPQHAHGKLSRAPKISALAALERPLPRAAARVDGAPEQLLAYQTAPPVCNARDAAQHVPGPAALGHPAGPPQPPQPEMLPAGPGALSAANVNLHEAQPSPGYGPYYISPFPPAAPLAARIDSYLGAAAGAAAPMYPGDSAATAAPDASYAHLQTAFRPLAPASYAPGVVLPFALYPYQLAHGLPYEVRGAPPNDGGSSNASSGGGGSVYGNPLVPRAYATLPPVAGGSALRLDPCGSAEVVRTKGVGERPNMKRRTKTGCLTCRRRRIKCDEQRPICRKCLRGERLCVGYDDVFDTKLVARFNRLRGARKAFRASKSFAHLQPETKQEDGGIYTDLEELQRASGCASSSSSSGGGSPGPQAALFRAWPEVVRTFIRRVAAPLDVLLATSRFTSIGQRVAAYFRDHPDEERHEQLVEIELIRQLVALVTLKDDLLDTDTLCRQNIKKRRYQSLGDGLLLRAAAEALMKGDGELCAIPSIDAELQRRLMLLHSVLYKRRAVREDADIAAGSPDRELRPGLLDCLAVRVSQQDLWAFVRWVARGGMLLDSWALKLANLVTSCFPQPRRRVLAAESAVADPRGAEGALQTSPRRSSREELGGEAEFFLMLNVYKASTGSARQSVRKRMLALPLNELALSLIEIEQLNAEAADVAR